ncbi:MAG: MBL fold metallo-hydrolase [Planctomycetes bacterium]|nr:MBL fold metallo-hydrolase [Planctomycetota bacterium]
MRITFHGAARTVTGSRHLVETASGGVLLDCGLVQGPRKEAEKRNREFGFDPKSVAAVVLSHAHIDHAGNLPLLMKKGFDGNIFCTPATRDIASAMLRDSANIQVSDARFLNRQKRPSEPEAEPLYTLEDAHAAIARMVAVPYGRTFEVLPGGVTGKFADAGHILGSAVTVLKARRGGSSKTVVFTGDVGRRNFPILRDPQAVEQGDAFITESTYANRDHGGDVAAATEQLLEIVKRTVARGGHLVVPAFALGRAQSLAYVLHQLWSEGRLPRIPLFVDSPLSLDVTAIYKLHPECFDKQTLAYLDDDKPGDPFGFSALTYLRTTDESKTLNAKQGPFLVIAASGMCEGGRVLHHLKHGVMDPRNTILIVGFCAQHTLGRRLADGAPVAKIYGVEYPVKAEVVRLDGMSQHAGRGELIEYAMTQKKASIGFCVHGEEEQVTAMKDAMLAGGFSKVEAPKLGESFDV